MKKAQAIRYIIVFIVPLILGLFTRSVFMASFANDWFNLMSWSFFVFVPMGMGLLTTWLADENRIRKKRYRVLLPCASVLLFAIVTFSFDLEGWACWIMILPVFLAAATIGGFIGAYFRLRRVKNDKAYVSLLVLAPFLLSPIEQAVELIPGQYKAYTVIDIAASKEQIWPHVTRVSEIDPKEDKGWFTRFMGFPRPIRAELDYEGVGAFRKAIFDKGLVFDEHVTHYDHEKNMTFSIKANPHEIPAATMDEHIVIGGKYFDVLDGTYELEPLNDTTCRLHLYSHFRMSTTFNFYAGIWGRWIMQDIQNNILQVIKKRSEVRQQ